MELWQMDVVGGFHLSDGVEVKVVTGIDDHSRFIVVAAVLVVPSGRAVCEAFTAALEESQAFIRNNKKEAADIYVAMSGDKRMTAADLLGMLNNPEYIFTNVPQNVMKYATFMHSTGSMKKLPASWKDLFFPNVQALAGS